MTNHDMPEPFAPQKATTGLNSYRVVELRDTSNAIWGTFGLFVEFLMPLHTEQATPNPDKTYNDGHVRRRWLVKTKSKVKLDVDAPLFAHQDDSDLDIERSCSVFLDDFVNFIVWEADTASPAEPRHARLACSGDTANPDAPSNGILGIDTPFAPHGWNVTGKFANNGTQKTTIAATWTFRVVVRTRFGSSSNPAAQGWDVDNAGWEWSPWTKWE
jgi:hypothetical protein